MTKVFPAVRPKGSRKKKLEFLQSKQTGDLSEAIRMLF